VSYDHSLRPSKRNYHVAESGFQACDPRLWLTSLLRMRKSHYSPSASRMEHVTHGPFVISSSLECVSALERSSAGSYSVCTHGVCIIPQSNSIPVLQVPPISFQCSFNMSVLEQLKGMTTVVADTGDFESV
jgi:hypothetical protein